MPATSWGSRKSPPLVRYRRRFTSAATFASGAAMPLLMVVISPLKLPGAGGGNSFASIPGRCSERSGLGPGVPVSSAPRLG